MELARRANLGSSSAVPEARININNYRKVTIQFTQSMVIPENALEAWQNLIKKESRNLARDHPRIPVKAIIAPNGESDDEE